MSTSTFTFAAEASVPKETLNAGIIGLGFIGEVHARAIRATGHNVHSIAGAFLNEAEQSRERIGAQYARQVEDLISDPEIDVIHICTPNLFHADYAELAIKNGKHVICEKPLATTSSQARLLHELALEHGVIATVPFIYRYYPNVREARARIANSTSKPFLLHGYYLQDWLASDSVENWRIDPKLGGPSRAFGDIGVHWCDIVEFVTGDRIVRVNAQLLKVYSRRGNDNSVDTEDGGTIIFETDSGAQGSLVLSQVSAGRKNKLWFSLEGHGYSYVFDQENPDSLWQGGRESNQVFMRGHDLQSVAANRFSVLPAGHPQGYQDCFNAFIDDSYRAISEGASDGLPLFIDGLRAAMLTEAVLKSAASREWVDI